MHGGRRPCRAPTIAGNRTHNQEGRPMKKALTMAVAAIGWLVLAAGTAAAAESACITCHEKVTPGIVADWKKSAMADQFDCAKCHGDQHRGADDAAKAAMPTPETCKACHK